MSGPTPLPDMEVVTALRKAKLVAEGAIREALLQLVAEVNKASLPPHTRLDELSLEVEWLSNLTNGQMPRGDFACFTALRDVILRVKLRGEPGTGLRWEQFL